MNEAWFLSVNSGGIHAHPDGSTTICGMMQVNWKTSASRARYRFQTAGMGLWPHNPAKTDVSVLRTRQSGFLWVPRGFRRGSGIAVNSALAGLYTNCTRGSHIVAFLCGFLAFGGIPIKEVETRNSLCFIEYFGVGAGDGNRTHVRSLGSFYTAIVDARSFL